MAIKNAVWSARYQKVRCRLCRREYVCTLLDDYYGSTCATDGVCLDCLVREREQQKSEPVKIKEQVNQLCRPPQSSPEETCRFLAAGEGGMCCLKGSNLEYLIQAKRDQMRAQGDNCSGPPNFVPASKRL